jgi:hypothetical protein
LFTVVNDNQQRERAPRSTYMPRRTEVPGRRRADPRPRPAGHVWDRGGNVTPVFAREGRSAPHPAPAALPFARMSNLTRTSPAPLAPARTLREVKLNCDPDVPLESSDQRWEDLSLARGDDALQSLERELKWREPERFVHAAFVSHRGSGKSTEILRLVDRVEELYTTVYIPATIEMNPFEIEAEDLLLTIAIAVEAEMARRGTPLASELLERVVKWFDDVVRTTKWAAGFQGEAAVGLEGKVGVPMAATLFGSLKALFKTDSEYRTEVKQVLRKYPGTLLQSVNDILDEATHALGGRALLVVIDNLDRYDPEVIDRLLVASSDRIRQLRCNLLLTPPIGLLLQPKSAQLDRIYSCHFLYAVRLRAPDQAYDCFDGPGRDLLEKALARRIDLDTMIPRKAVRDRLISASGGAIRELLNLVSQACLLARGETIEEDDVERALSKRKQRLRDLINANGWMSALVTIARDKQISPDQKCLDVLFHYLAFKYDGDGWYDIHPLVAEIPEFERARRGDDR